MLNWENLRLLAWIRVVNGGFYPIKEGPTLKPNSQRLGICRGWNYLSWLIEVGSKPMFSNTCGLHMTSPHLLLSMRIDGIMVRKDSPSCQSMSLTLEACPNIKKLKRACIKSFQHFDTLDSQNSRSSIDTNFIAHYQPTFTKWFSHLCALKRSNVHSRFICLKTMAVNTKQLFKDCNSHRLFFFYSSFL